MLANKAVTSSKISAEEGREGGRRERKTERDVEGEGREREREGGGGGGGGERERVMRHLQRYT